MTATDVIPGDGSVPRVAVRGIALAILVHNLPVLVWARPILAVELALKSIIRRIVEILVLIREREKKKQTHAMRGVRTLRLPLAHPHMRELSMREHGFVRMIIMQ